MTSCENKIMTLKSNCEVEWLLTREMRFVRSLWNQFALICCTWLIVFLTTATTTKYRFHSSIQERLNVTWLSNTRVTSALFQINIAIRDYSLGSSLQIMKKVLKYRLIDGLSTPLFSVLCCNLNYWKRSKHIGHKRSTRNVTLALAKFRSVIRDTHKK